jgi:hypothetical protein
MVHYGPEVAEVLNSVPDLHTRSLDEPIVVSRDFDPGAIERTRYYNEWVRPQGIIEAIHLKVMRQRTRIGGFTMSRHESAGVMSDRDVAILEEVAIGPAMKPAACEPPCQPKATETLRNFCDATASKS